MSQALVNLFNTSVQEAVQSTIQHNKPLFVFLAKYNDQQQDDDASKQFLEKFIDQEETTTLLSHHFVLLKLFQGTMEYLYFNQIFTSLIVPSFYIVQQGKVLAVITESTTKDQFMQIVNNLTKPPSPAPPPQPSPQLPQESSMQPSTQANVLPTTQPVQSHAPIASRSPQTHVENSATSGATLKSPESHERSVKKHQEEFNKLKREQREERLRLRALLEADRREQLLRSQEQQRLYHHETDKPQEQQQPLTKQLSHDGTCMLSIKLFDGTSIKQEFDATDKLADVRTWLDEEIQIIPSDTSMPSFAKNVHYPSSYAFHRPMLPRITYTREQELGTLEELELTPRSALILKPIFHDADEDSGSENGVENPGIIRRAFGAVGKLADVLYSFFDYGAHEAEYHPLNTNDHSDHAGSNTNANDDGEPLNLHISEARPLLSLDSRTSSLLNIDMPSVPVSPPAEVCRPQSPLISNSNISSTFQSRSSTPRPGSRMRIQTLYDEDRDKDGIDTYNGNSVSLNERPEKEDN